LAARCGNLEVVKLLLREDAEVARRCKVQIQLPVHLEMAVKPSANSYKTAL